MSETYTPPPIWMGPLLTEPAAYSPPGVLLEKCDRCRCAGPHKEELIHEGRSTRRDCGRCGRTLGFPRWDEPAETPGKPTTKARRPRRSTKTTKKK